MSERAANAREHVAERCREAGLSTKRFVHIPDGQKGGKVAHTQREPDDPTLSGNYAVYAGPGADGDGWHLIEVDRDDHELAEQVGVSELLPETFAVRSPHTPKGKEGHSYVAIKADTETVIETVRDVTGGTTNINQDWGEIKVQNQFVVGPGSQIEKGEKGCDKDWCDECAQDDGGYYEIANDTPIELMSVQWFRALVEAGYGNDVEADEDQTTLDVPTDEAPTVDLDLSDEQLLDKARNAKNGAKFCALESGSDSMHGGDTSVADKAYCQHLAFWTQGDRQRMDRLFRQSDRMRSKWDETHRGDGDTYGEMTIDAALDDQTEYYDPGRTRQSREASADGGTSTASTSEHLLDGANDHHIDAGGGGGEWDSLPVYNSRGNINTRETRRRVADILLDNNEFATPKPEGVNVDKTPLFRYWPEEGFYERSGAAWVNRRLARKAPYLESADIKEIVNRLRRSSFVDWEAFDAGRYDETLVNLGNGVYDLDRGVLREHDPKYLFRTYIPRVYDPDAECPNIRGFINDVVADEAERDTLIEWIGYCLEVGYPIHRFLILYGGGRNGKSAYFRLVREFLSDDNVSGVTLDTIASGGFGVSALDDNLLNVDTESADTRLKPSQLNTLKALSGGDQRQVDVKYEEPHEMENSAKLAFAANNPPRFEEDTDAVADRLLTIEFPYRFGNDANADKPAVPERELMASLTTEEELSGLLNLALQGLERVRERGYFSIEEGSTARERFTEYMSEADSIVGFANRCLENDPEFALPKPAIYAAYKAYCKGSEHTPAEEAAFFRQLGRKTDVETYAKRPRVVTEGSASEYKTHVLDHLWITDEAIGYLSESARNDVMLTVAHMHPSSVDHAIEKLDVETPSEDDGAVVPEIEVPDDAHGQQADEDRVMNCLVALDDERGRAVTRDELHDRVADRYDLSPERILEMIEKLLKGGRAYHPATAKEGIAPNR